MKKLTLMAILLSLALVACGEKKVEEVKETATQAVEQVKETANEAVAEVKETTSQAVDQAKETTNETVAEVKDKANEAMAEVKETAEKAMTEVKDKANETIADAKDKANQVMADAKAAMTDTLKFKGEDGTEYSLNLKDDNAVLKTSTGEEYTLKADVSGSGERYADEKGNEIHFKGNSGIVNLNGKQTSIELVK